jgi:hypothetical protein
MPNSQKFKEREEGQMLTRVSCPHDFVDGNLVENEQARHHGAKCQGHMEKSHALTTIS